MTVKYTKDHEWIKVDGTTGTVGISDYAQSQLGDVVFVELPEVGRELTQGGESAVVESVKAASEVYAPVAGTVTAANEALVDEPALVNSAAQTGGWFYQITIADPSQLDGLMDEDAYKAYVEGLA
ncbi:glycine cleavage system H protein [Azospirillum fermentarium]|uniref:glycine cleavage system protein GcvH n=1 Tax=Azospirillum fermentarium TaxID=1233114 RepID=UPI0022270794|nr:glycine cleavage system protein GcvH [Azospirillum fermentarium]MCW2247374.1 glycine cleavage system H protein [Azospirillum fermentarium]